MNLYTISSLILGCLFAYAMFSYEEEDESPELKAPPKPEVTKVKRHGYWMNEERRKK